MVGIIDQLITNLRGQQVAGLPVAPFGFTASESALWHPFLEDVLHPLLIAETVEIGIRFVEHFVAWLLSLIGFVAVLCARRCMRKRVFHIVCFDELLFELFPLLGVGFQREGVREEIVGSRILVHTPYEIGDGIEEMFLFYNWCVENDMVAQFLLCSPNMVGHSFEHFEAEAVFRGVIHLGEQVGIGDGE